MSQCFIVTHVHCTSATNISSKILEMLWQKGEVGNRKCNIYFEQEMIGQRLQVAEGLQYEMVVMLELRMVLQMVLFALSKLLLHRTVQLRASFGRYFMMNS